MNISGYILDFRQVPLVIGALYGGRRVAVVLILILLSYRFYLDIPGFHLALFSYSLLLISLILIIPLFRNTVNMRRKVQMAILASLFGAGSRMALIHEFFSEKLTVGSLVVLFLSYSSNR